MMCIKLLVRCTKHTVSIDKGSELSGKHHIRSLIDMYIIVFVTNTDISVSFENGCVLTRRPHTRSLKDKLYDSTRNIYPRFSIHQ